jgi:hypothetical protein
MRWGQRRADRLPGISVSHLSGQSDCGCLLSVGFSTALQRDRSSSPQFFAAPLRQALSRYARQEAAGAMWGAYGRRHGHGREVPYQCRRLVNCCMRPIGLGCAAAAVIA